MKIGEVWTVPSTGNKYRVLGMKGRYCVKCQFIAGPGLGKRDSNGNIVDAGKIYQRNSGWDVHGWVRDEFLSAVGLSKEP